MDVALYINSVQIEVIEIFDDFLVIQELKTKEIYSIYYWQIDTLTADPKSDKIINNVISLEWYKQHVKK